MAVTPFILLSYNAEKIIPDGGKYLSPDALDDQDAMDSYFFVIDGDDVQQAKQILVNIRNHLDTRIYLKPVVLGVGVAQKDRLLSASVDLISHVDETAFPLSSEQEEIVNTIRTNKGSPKKEVSVLGAQQISLRILRFMSSRQHTEQEPIVSPDVLTGYSYPRLEVFFPNIDASIWDMLESLKNQHLIEGRFISRAYHCTHCECAFLDFMEICPDCSSPNIESDDMIHHFRCGHTEAMQKFKQDDVLVCPKCHLGLKQIGVDYDKPSLVFSCNECQYIFEEPGTTTVCYNCGRRTNPENQVQRVIYAYRITALGQNIAIFGQEQLFTKILKENINIIDHDAFQRMVEMEVARIERYKHTQSSVVVLDLKGLSEALVRLGERGIDFYHDIAAAFVAELRISDAMTIVGRSKVTILLTETDAAGAEVVMQRLIVRVDGIFYAALSVNSDVTGRVIDVDHDFDLKQETHSLG